MSDERKYLDNIMKIVNKSTDNVSNHIPELCITSGIIDATTLFKKLEELEKYTNVNFTEDGLIPEYISFDRNNSDLYHTLEEILTVYINNKNSGNSTETKEDGETIFIIPSNFFKNGIKKDVVIDIKKYHENILKHDIKINEIINEFDNVYNLSRETYLEILNSNGSIDDIKNVYFSIIITLEKSILEMREYQSKLLFKHIDLIYDDIINYLVNKENIQELCIKFTMIKNSIDLYLINFMEKKYHIIKDAVLLDYHKTLCLLKLNQ